MSQAVRTGYRIELRRHVRGSDRKVVLSKSIQLPFVPHVGMDISADSWQVHAAQVEWSVAKGLTYVRDDNYTDKTRTLGELRESLDPHGDWDGWDLARDLR
jgi:hypothetical protein